MLTDPTPRPPPPGATDAAGHHQVKPAANATTQPATSIATPPLDVAGDGLSRWAWGWPPLLLLLGAPLWLHVWEPAMFLAINRWCAPLPGALWAALSLLGNGWALLTLTAPLLVLAPRLMLAWLCAAPFAVLFARTGKAWIESPRPAAVVDNAQMRVVGELLHNVSMPSGHTLTAFAVAAGLYFALPLAPRRRYGWLLLLAAAGTGLSRMAVGAHWPGDVVVGASLGLLAGLLGRQLWRRLPDRWADPTGWVLRAVALLVAVAVGYVLTEELDFAENHHAQQLLAVWGAGSLLAFAWRSAGLGLYKK